MVLVRLYEKMMALYPASYREQYAEEMTRAFEDMLQDNSRILARIVLLARVVIDLPISVVKQNVVALDEAYMSDMPTYVKRNSEVSVFLLVPFAVLLIVNEVLPSVLPQTTDWIRLFQFLAAALPAVAFIFCLGTLVAWCCSVRRTHGTTLLDGLRDMKHNWPMVCLSIVSIMITSFVVGHDAVGCVQRNPIMVIRDLNTTIQCMDHN